MSLNKRSIELGTEGWGVKEDNLLAFRKDRTRYVEKPFEFERGTAAVIVNKDGLIENSPTNGIELITNSGFDTDSGWSTDSNWSIGNGSASADGTSSNNINQGTLIPTVGKTYKITFEVLNISQGYFQARLGNVLGAKAYEEGIYTSYVTATTNDRIRIYGKSSAIGSIDNISVQEVNTDTPRISYDIVDGVVSDKPHLLLEPARTNLITYSEDFGGYSNSNSTDTPNDATSPEGVSNATSFKEQATTGQHKLVTTATFDGSSTYTFSIFAKYNGRDLFIDTQNSNEWEGRAWFDLSLGTANSILGSASIEDYGDGWYRCLVTGDSGLSGSNNVELLTSNGSTNSTTGDTTKGVYIWGAQLEQGSYATSYIPNYGTSNGVTRAAETANNCGAVQDFNDDEGVFFVESAALADDATERRLTISNGTTNERVLFAYDAASQDVHGFVGTAGGNFSAVIAHPSDIREFSRYAIKYKSGDYAFWINGYEVDSSNISIAPTGLNILKFQDAIGSLDFYAKVKELKVYTEELNDTELRLLTKYAPRDYDAAFTADYVDSSVEFTVLRTEATDKLYYVISDGANNVSGSATITATQVTISNIDISSLSDGTLTLSVYIEDLRQQRGITVTDTTIKDTVNAPLYSYALQQRATGATFEDLDNAEGIIESLNVEV